MLCMSGVFDKGLTCFLEECMPHARIHYARIHSRPRLVKGGNNSESRPLLSPL